MIKYELPPPVNLPTKKKKKETRLYEAINKEEFSKIISHIKSKKILLAVNIAYYSGLRIEEIINLQPDEIRNPLSEIITNLVGEIRPLIFPKIETALYLP